MIHPFPKSRPELRQELLTLAKEAGATVGKLQKRHPKELLTEEPWAQRFLLARNEGMDPTESLLGHCLIPNKVVFGFVGFLERPSLPARIIATFKSLGFVTTARACTSEDQYNAPHPAPHHSYGGTYGAHREFLELSLEDHKELQANCQSIGLEYSSSVWDITSAKEIISLNPTLIKVGSPSNLHWEMQELLRDTYQGEVHISTGMTSREDVDKIIEFWERGKGDAKNRVVLYACTSAYPVQFKDVCLLEIARLKEQYEDRVKAIGFSGHHLGIAIDIAAYVLGATWIERHFTKDRTWKGTDHAASLEFPGLSKLIRDLRATTVSLSYKDGILDVEKEQEAKLKWGFYNARPKEAAKDATAKDAEAEC